MAKHTRTQRRTPCIVYIGGCLLAIVGIPIGLFVLSFIGPYILAGVFIVLTLAVIGITLTNGLFSQGR